MKRRIYFDNYVINVDDYSVAEKEDLLGEAQAAVWRLEEWIDEDTDEEDDQD